TTHNIGLRTSFDDVTTNINIAFGNGLIYVQGRQVIIRQFGRVDLNFVDFFFSSKAYDTRNARYRYELTFDDPILNGCNLLDRSVASDYIAENFTGSAIRWFDLCLGSFREIHALQAIGSILLRIKIIYTIFKNNSDHGQT